MTEKAPAIITGVPGEPNARITVFIDNAFHSFLIDSTRGARLYEAIKTNAEIEHLREIVAEDLWHVQRDFSESLILDSKNRLRLVDANGQSRVVDYGLSGVIQRMAEQGFDVTPLTAFLSKVDQNPNKDIANELYRFLERGKLPITPEGDFLAFKNVQPDYFSFVGGQEAVFYKTADSEDAEKVIGQAFYPVGGVVWMNREDCDEDRGVLCSRGLHVCSYDYLPNFYLGRGIIIICRINPRDVTSIPHNENTKLRCCRLEVVAEIPAEAAEEYFTAAVDARHPSVKASPESAPENAPIDWVQMGVERGWRDGQDDRNNGYSFGPELRFPPELDLESTPTLHRQGYAQGYFQGYAQGWDEGDDKLSLVEEEDDDEFDDRMSESAAAELGDEDGIEQAEKDWPEYEPDYAEGSHWHIVAMESREVAKAYRREYDAAYLRRHSELTNEAG